VSEAALAAPTLADVQRARERIRQVIRPTPLLDHALLRAESGLDIFVKHENHNPTGAFKVRGGLNLIGEMAERGDRRPIITATTGNHGQSIALACRIHELPCTIVTPRGNNPEKNAAMRALGADVVEHGSDFDAAREEVERRAAGGTRRYVHSANEPLLIAGVATYALEIFEALADIDVVYVPVGGGSGASGLVTVRDALASETPGRHHTRIVGVQASGADAFARSWRSGRRVTADRVHTFAEGMATRTTYDLPFGILSRGLDDVVTLEDDALAEGVRVALRLTHNLAEGAGAAALAAALVDRERLKGQRVVVIMTGGNIDQATLTRILSDRAL
jgi:threonine dehydratase